MASVKNNLVVKSNELIKGTFSNMKTNEMQNITTNEYKIITLLISKIDKNKPNFESQTLTVEEVATFLGVNINGVYQYLNTLENGLLNKKIYISNKEGDRIKYNWFSHTKYVNGAGVLEIVFNPYLKPFLLALESNFTSYYLENIKDLNNIYSLRLYENLTQYKNIKGVPCVTFNLETLKEQLNIKKEYAQYKDFKKYILIKAEKEINAKTDIIISFEEIKEGRKVSKIKFHIIKTQKQLREKDKNKNNSCMKLLQQKIKDKLKVKINEKVLENLIKTKGFENVEFYIDNFDKFSGKKGNVAGFLIKAIENDYEIPKEYQSKPIQLRNFEERIYDKEYFDNIYEEL